MVFGVWSFSWLVLSADTASWVVFPRDFASHSLGLGQLYCMHFVRLCPSPGVVFPVPWLWLLLEVCFSMLVGVEVVVADFSFFIRCDLRGWNGASMLTDTVSSLVADVFVWSFGHQLSFSSDFIHCVRTSVVGCLSVDSCGSTAVVQTFI